ncbi:beta galactosidase jelly roll domain-containing protein [bacterium]|nr:beta galactosidase jelly roll domain-containing protein [bacterium]
MSFKNFLLLLLIGSYLFPASLLPTFHLKNLEGEWIPFQNDLPYPAFEPQPSHHRLHIDGLWEKARLKEADHSLSLAQRTPQLLVQFRQELVKLNWEKISPPLIDNPYPDKNEGVIWYRKSFHLSNLPEGKALLVFFSVNYIADVWLNGHYLGYHEGGYTPFAFDATKSLKKGENLLEVRVDNIPWGTRDDILPKGACDWWNYGGIVGEVYLEFLPKLNIVRLDLKPLNTKGEFKARVLLWNTSDKAISSRIEISCFGTNPKNSSLDPSPHSIADKSVRIQLEGETKGKFRLKPGELKPMVFKLRIPSPRLWSPENPNLYVIRAKIDGGDEFWNQFGFRFLSVSDGYLLLNGKKVFLPGVSRHEDSLKGRAMDWEMICQDLKIIKELGAKFVRATHYPNHPYTLIFADRIGLTFWEEIPIYWMGDREIENVLNRGIAQQMFLEMLFKDISRPSLCFLGACNECGGNKRAELLRELRKLSERVDGTRLLGQASVGQFFNDPTQKEADVLGFNFYWEVFYGGDAYSSTIEAIEKMRSAFPDKPIIATEWGYWSCPDWHTVDKQLEIADKTFRAFTSKPYFIAGCAWFIAFDYHSFLVPEETFGLLTIDRKSYKPVYYLLQKLYQEYQ